MAMKKAYSMGLGVVLAAALACSSDIAVPDTGDTTPIRDGTLHISASATGDGSSVSVSAVVENRKNVDVSLTPDIGCPLKIGPLQLAVYRDQVPERRAYYGQGQPSFTVGQVCTGEGLFIVMKPGGRRTFNLTVSSAAILGDSLPAGIYTVRVAGDRIAAEVAGEIPLGSFALKK